jgi:methyl coenzyme M reductase subunit D
MYKENSEGNVDLSIKKCPNCRNEINNIDKKHNITGIQFVNMIAQILLNIENREDCIQEMYDAYDQIYECDYNNIDTGISPDEIYDRIVSWRNSMCENLEYDFRNSDIQTQKDTINHIIKYNDMIDICIKHFGFTENNIRV